MAKKDQEIEDTGLGLTGFLNRGEEKSPSEEIKAKVEEKPIVEEKKTDVSHETKVETKTEKKAAIAAEEKKTDVKIVEPEKKVETAKAETPLGPNWDDDNNPWKKKANELDQRYRDTHRNWNQTHQETLTLKQQLSILQKKLDGTYDPAKDEPRPPDPMVERRLGAIEGKAQASLVAAFRTHGKDVTMGALQRYAELFGQDRIVQERILAADDPVQSAIDAVNGYDFFSKYGNDPQTIIAKLRQELEAEYLPKIREAETKRLMAELSTNKGEPKGIGKIQGQNGISDKTIQKDNAGRPKSLGAIFGS